MQPKQLIGAVLAIGLPLAAVWMMMQPPGGGAAPTAPSAGPTTAPTAPTAKPAATAASAPVRSAVLDEPVPVPKAHATPAASPVAPAKKAVGDEYALYFTANGLGETDDCGCKKRPLGGIARRSQWIKDRQKEKRYKAWISVSAGGLLTADAAGPIPPAPELDSLATAFFKSYKTMNYVAMNAGIQDLAMGLDNLKAAAAREKFAIVSANVLQKSSGKSAFEPHVVAPLGKIKVGIFGLLAADPPGKKRWIDDQGLTVASPVDAAKAEVKALRALGCQLIVAVAQLSDAERDDIGEKVPGVDLVLGSLKQDLTHQRPESMGRGFFADPYHKGKWLGEFIVRPGTRQDRWQVVGLREKLQTEQVSLERQITYYVKEFQDDDAAKAKGETPKMNERERKFAEERFAGVRAKLARVKLEMQDELDVKPGASTLQMNMYPMRADELKEDPAILAIVDAHKKVFPPPPKSH